MSDQSPSADPAPEVPPSSGAGDAPRETLGAAPQVARHSATEPDAGVSTAPKEAVGGAPVPAQSSGPDARPDAGTHAVETAPAPEPADESKARTRGRGGGILVTAIILAIVLVGAGAYYFFSYRTSPARAGVGSCLSGTEDPKNVKNIRLIDCSDAGATFKVTQKIDNQPKESNETACAGTAYSDVYWYSRPWYDLFSGSRGTVLCLLKLHG